MKKVRVNYRLAENTVKQIEEIKNIYSYLSPELEIDNTKVVQMAIAKLSRSLEAEADKYSVDESRIN